MTIPLLLLASYGMCFGFMNEKLPLLTRVLNWLPIGRTEGGNLFERMATCAFCTGFHTGWMVWTASRVVVPSESWYTFLLGALVFAFASAAFCYTIDVTLQRIEYEGD